MVTHYVLTTGFFTAFAVQNDRFLAAGNPPVKKLLRLAHTEELFYNQRWVCSALFRHRHARISQGLSQGGDTIVEYRAGHSAEACPLHVCR